jgi:hypothetical protein
MTLDDLEQQYGLPPGLLAAIRGAEGSGPTAVSPKGAKGTFQFMPETAQAYGLTDPTNTDAAAQAAARYMSDAMQRYGTNDPKVLMAEYNGGPRQAKAVLAGSQPPARETQNYIKKAPMPTDYEMDWLRKNAPQQSGGDEMAWLRANAPKQQESVGPLQAGVLALGRGFDTAAAGLRQITPEPIRNALDKVDQFTGAQSPSIDPAVQKQNTQAYAGVQQQQPLATLAGELPKMVLGKTPLGMAGIAALDYGTPEERALNAAGAGIGGALGNVAGRAVGRVIQPVQSAANSVVDSTKALLDKYGVPALPGQITNSTPVKWLESVVGNLPGGGSVRATQEAQAAALQRGAMAAAGGSGDAVTPAAINAAKSTVGATFNTAPKGVAVNLDDKFVSDLASVESGYLKNLSPDQKGIVKQYLNDVLSQGDTMAGDVYQKARSRIAARAASTTDSELKTALTGIRNALDGAFARSASEDTNAAMKTARTQWSGIKDLEGIASPDGVSAARLANATKNSRGDLAEVGQLAGRLRPMPMSGSAERLLYQGLLSGGIGAGAGLANGDPGDALKYGAGSFVAPWIAAQALTRAPIRNYLTNTALSDEAKRLLLSGGSTFGGLLGLRSAQ